MHAPARAHTRPRAHALTHAPARASHTRPHAPTRTHTRTICRQGYLPMLLHRFAHVSDQTSLDFVPLTSRYKDDAPSGTCACQLGTGSETGHAWAYSIRAEKADFDSAAPWALPAGTHDAAFALEVAEHLWAGPQNFFLNVARRGLRARSARPHANAYTAHTSRAAHTRRSRTPRSRYRGRRPQYCRPQTHACPSGCPHSQGAQAWGRLRRDHAQLEQPHHATARAGR